MADDLATEESDGELPLDSVPGEWGTMTSTSALTLVEKLTDSNYSV